MLYVIDRGGNATITFYKKKKGIEIASTIYQRLFLVVGGNHHNFDLFNFLVNLFYNYTLTITTIQNMPSPQRYGPCIMMLDHEIHYENNNIPKCM